MLAVAADVSGEGRAAEYCGEQDGWLTSAVSRPAMIENLAAMLATAPGLFQSPQLLNECRTFVRHVDGSSAAMAGAHDDCVMAMAVGLAARQMVVGRFSQGAFGLASFARQNSGVAGDRIPQDGKFVRH
ncbi:MAG TPA: hypothetical protein VN684_05885 [Terriglobales bacterium]|nr:hypothetical protein [Terriglobales bacterium]